MAAEQNVSKKPDAQAMDHLYAAWKLIWIEDAPHVVDGPKRLDRFAQALDATYGFGARFQREEDPDYGL